MSQPDLLLVTYGPDPIECSLIATDPPSVLAAVPQGQQYSVWSGRHIDAYKETQIPSHGRKWFKFHLHPR